jgi:hypothetical protein
MRGRPCSYPFTNAHPSNFQGAGAPPPPCHSMQLPGPEPCLARVLSVALPCKEIGAKPSPVRPCKTHSPFRPTCYKQGKAERKETGKIFPAHAYSPREGARPHSCKHGLGRGGGHFTAPHVGMYNAGVTCYASSRPHRGSAPTPRDSENTGAVGGATRSDAELRSWRVNAGSLANQDRCRHRQARTHSGREYGTTQSPAHQRAAMTARTPTARRARERAGAGAEATTKSHTARPSHPPLSRSDSPHTHTPRQPQVTRRQPPGAPGPAPMPQTPPFGAG